MVDCIGVFYKTPFGVVKTLSYSKRTEETIIGWVKIRRTKGFRNYYQSGFTKQSETKDWVRLTLKDFPESVDNVLPYSFDLFFDIKRMSQLRKAFSYEDSEELLEMMKNHNIKFKKKKTRSLIWIKK
jgi:hypothetical protein